MINIASNPGFGLPKRTSLQLLLMLTAIFSPVLHAQNIDPLLIEAVRWYTGETGRVDDVKARALLEEAVLDDDVLSRMWLARVYSTGRMTYEADKARAQTLAEAVIADIEMLADSGLAEAQFLMGTAYAEGLGKVVDAELAVDWYHKAAAQGHVLAQHNLGNVSYSGTGTDQDYAQAVYWWQLAAAQGDAIPQYRLGNMYEEGLGVIRDPAMAEYWYREAASRGNANAAAALEKLTE